MKPLYKKLKDESANITLIAIMMLLVLSLVGATVLLNTTIRYNGSMNIGDWQEALPAAEAGSDVGLTNCRWTTWTAGAGVNKGFDTTNGWSLVDPTNSQGQNITFTSPLGYSYTLPAQYTLPTFQQAGQGSGQTWATVVVDAPTSLIDSQGNQWFRIRSTGYASLPPHDRISIDTRSDPTAKAANALRKFSFNIDRLTGAALTTPQSTRRIEVMAQPVPSFGAAIIANSSLKAVNSGYVVDSFDSRDPTKSTNGQYDPAKAQWNGNVYANFNNSFAPANLSGDIYGNVYTEGSTINNTGTIHGTTNYNSPDNYTPPVLAPTWTPSMISSNPAGGGSYQAGTVASPKYYVTSGAGNITINGPAGGAAGSVNIWITDDFQGSVTVPVGTTCRIWLTGAMKTPTINNLNNNASYLEFFGIGSTPDAQKIQTKDTTGYYAMIYAPYAQIKTGAGDIYGSIIGYDVNIKNSVHYDQAFNALGIAVDYTRASWVEDPR